LGGARYLAAVTSPVTARARGHGGTYVCSHFLDGDEERSLRELSVKLVHRNPSLEVELTSIEGDDSAALLEGLRATGHRANLHPAAGHASWQKDSVYNRVPAFFEDVVRRAGPMTPAVVLHAPRPMSSLHEAADRQHVEELLVCPGVDGQPLRGVLSR